MSNPYVTPQQYQAGNSRNQKPTGSVMAPAIALIVVAALGLSGSLLNIVLALVSEAPAIDPNAPQWLQDMQANQVGPVAVAVQACFMILNTVILVGGIQMLRLKMWGYALTASILAILNFGTCCCILGLPVGIWSIVVLSQPNVKNSFK